MVHPNLVTALPILFTLVAVQARAAPLVLSLEAGKDACVARVHDLGKSPIAERTLFRATSCPRQVLLDTAGKRAVTLEGEGAAAKLRAYALPGGAMTELGPAPSADVASLWIEASGELRATWIVTEGVTEQPAPKGSKARLVVTFQGKRFDIIGDDAAAYPSWGVPGVAVLGAFDGKVWKHLEVQPTKAEAGDTPGVAPLSGKPNAKAGVVSLGALQNAMICAGGGVLVCTSDAPAGGKQALLAAAKGHEADVENVGTVAFGKGALAFVVSQGDSVHAMSPAVFCKDGAATCKDSVVVEKLDKGGARQLALAVQGGFALLGDEYSGAHAKVFDSAGRVVLSLPSAGSAAFLPAGVTLE